MDQGGVVEHLVGKLNSLIGEHDGATERSINDRNSNHVFEAYDAIIDAARDTWRKLVAEPKPITSIGMRDWAHIGQHCSLWYKLNPRAPVSEQNGVFCLNTLDLCRPNREELILDADPGSRFNAD